MSNVLEEMKTRRSIRKFKPDAIPYLIVKTRGIVST